LGTGDWEVTANSATGTPNVLDCGTTPVAGGSICTATYPAFTNGKPTLVTLTATGADFGGWSINCANTAPVTRNGPNHCTVELTTDETVGVIFDNPAESP
jgi:hypothetical protein